MSQVYRVYCIIGFLEDRMGFGQENYCSIKNNKLFDCVLTYSTFTLTQITLDQNLFVTLLTTQNLNY